MEDRQPNEVRLDRKGKSTIPTVKVVRRGGYRGSFRGSDSSRGRPPNRPFNQRHFGHHPTTPHFRNHPSKISSGSPSNAPGRSFDHVKLEPSGNLGQSDQRPPKRTKLGSQQFFSGDSQSSERHFPRKGLSRINVPPDPPSQCPKGSPSNREAQPTFHKTVQNHYTVLRNRSEAVQSKFSSDRTPAVRKQFQHDTGVTATQGLGTKNRRTYGGVSPEVIPIENAAEPDAANSAARLPQLATPSTSSSPQVVLDPYQTGVVLSRTQSFAIPGNRTAVPSQVVALPEETIDITVNFPDPLANIPLVMQPRFFRSGVLKIKPISSKTPSAMDVTSAAVSSVSPNNNDSDDDVSSRELISGGSNLGTRPREDGRRIRASSQTPRDSANEPISAIPALISTPGSSRIPLDTHDKPRRVLNADRISSLVTVSMRGFVESLDTSSVEFTHNLRKPAVPAQEFVDDACILHAGDTPVIILAHAREEKQISYLTFESCKETSLRNVDRPWNKTKKGGTSAVATMMQPLMFTSGGHDHAVHIWNFSEDLMSVSSTLLAIKHTSVIQSLLPIRDTSHKLISAGADCNVHLWDLSSERVVHTFKTSNSPYHAHKTESPFCTLLEVGHRDLQFELRDHRMIPEHPAQRFGFYTTDLHGRFIKGDTWSHFFASGSRNGGVRLWDLRNVREQPAFVSCFSNEQVVQVLKTESKLWAFSKRGDVMTMNQTGIVAHL